MESLWSGIIGLAGVVIGVVLGYLLNNRSRRSEKRKEIIERVRFNIYRHLMELESYHFFIASFDMHGEEAPISSRKGFERTRSKIYDELFVYDGLEESEEVVRVMHSYGYASEMDRHHDIKQLVESLGKQISPNLQRMVYKINQENEAVDYGVVDEYLKRVRKLQV
jgi:hypothetical protein